MFFFFFFFMDDKENIEFPHYWNYCVEKPSITVSSHESHGKNHRQLKCLFESMFSEQQRKHFLTHWGRVTHICVSKTTIIGSDNGLSPGRRQAIIWTNAGILLIGTLGTNFSEILIECHSFSFKKMHMKMSSGKWRPSCLGLNVLKLHYILAVPSWGESMGDRWIPLTKAQDFGKLSISWCYHAVRLFLQTIVPQL